MFKIAARHGIKSVLEFDAIEGRWWLFMILEVSYELK